MSQTTLALARSFMMERLSAEQFSNAYMELWKYERDAEILLKDEAQLNECLSSIFCLVDLYNPESDGDEYELEARSAKLHTSGTDNAKSGKRVS